MTRPEAARGSVSEPETQAMVNFIEQLQPDVAIWYHQDLYVINPSSGREGAVRQRYAELTGLPMGQITGGTYTGIAATWARNELAPANGVAFIVELGPTLSPTEAATHTAATPAAAAHAAAAHAAAAHAAAALYPTLAATAQAAAA